jgi:hypothetical protein
LTRRKTFFTRRTRIERLIRKQRQRRHKEMIFKNVNKNVNRHDIYLNRLNLTHFKFWLDELMMKFHFSFLSNVNLDEFNSNLRRDLEQRKLNIKRRCVDRRDNDIYRASLQ